MANTVLSKTLLNRLQHFQLYWERSNILLQKRIKLIVQNRKGCMTM